jgi:hypothetical protein
MLGRKKQIMLCQLNQTGKCKSVDLSKKIKIKKASYHSAKVDLQTGRFV